MRRNAAALSVALFLLTAMQIRGFPAAGSKASAGAASSALRLGPEVPVTPNRLVDPLAQNSPTLAADPTNSRFIALANRLDAPDFACALQVSGDGGRGWTPANPVSKLPKGAEKCYAPEIAFDSGGTLYYLFVGLHTDGNTPMGVFLTTSRDRARSFTRPRKILGKNNFSVRMALDRKTDRLHLAWIQAKSDPGLGSFPLPPNPIVTAHSDKQC